jgi:hypothetical protein
MSTPVFVLLLVLIACSGAVLVINMLGQKHFLYDYWNLDNEDDTPPSRLDVLRTSAAFYSAAVVLVASVGVYLWLNHA